MVRAFVMVKTTAGSSEGLIASLRDVPVITEAHIVAGDHDIIVELDVDEIYEVLKTVASSVRSFEGVADTKTYISLE